MHWIDPNSLPKKSGTVERFVINPKGELDGLLFTDGTLVHFPPHLSAPVAASIKIGDHVTVYGVRPRDADLIAAVSLVTAKGKAMLDRGPDGDRKKASALHRTKLEAGGTVRRSLHGPKGELRGALLEDGTVLRISPHEARHVRDYLRPGAAVEARRWHRDRIRASDRRTRDWRLRRRARRTIRKAEARQSAREQAQASRARARA